MENKTTVLITGASGLVGTALTELLLHKGYEVKHLGRARRSISNVKSYVWNIEQGTIEPEALADVTYIVHLAGASIGEGRWTEQRKKEILSSRVGSTLLLNQALEEYPHSVKKIIAASAIGYYGLRPQTSPFNEEAPAGKDFMAQVCVAWEEALFKGPAPIQKVAFRFGVVFSNQGGAFPKLVLPVKLLAATPVGSGKQIISWVHIDDVCNAIRWAIENPHIQGIYNLTAPHPVSNAELMKVLAKALNKPYIPFGPPALALKVAMGEQADIVLEGVAVSSEKLQRAGFEFRFKTIEETIKELLKS